MGLGRQPGQWTLIGPQPLVSPNTSPNGGPSQHSGWINAVAVDPRNANVVYLGANGGGVWKTTDGGQTWTPLTDNQPSLEIGALALDPTNPDIVYAGTTFSNAFFGNMGAGILKSSDGGSTWTVLPGPLPTGPGLEAYVQWLAVSPSNGNVVLAVDASTQGAAVYRSADGGNTWKQVLASSGVYSGQVVFDPSNGNIAYATLGGVYKSTDGGNTWASANGTGTRSCAARRLQSPVEPLKRFTSVRSALQHPDVQNRGRGTKLDSLAGCWRIDLDFAAGRPRVPGDSGEPCRSGRGLRRIL